MKLPALQLYTVRHALAQNAEDALQRVRAAGYTAVETAPLPPNLTPHKLGELLNRFDLRAIAIHCELPLGEKRHETLEAASALGTQRLIWHGWPRDPLCDSADGVRRLADRYNQAHEFVQRHGGQFGLHNHWWEFERVEGVYPYQLLNEFLSPGIFLEIDVYWVQTAGLDPARVIKELGTRVGMLHLKDGPAVQGQPMTALGGGVLNLSEIFQALKRPVDCVVELDECATDPFAAAQQSLQFVEQFSAQGPQPPMDCPR